MALPNPVNAAQVEAWNGEEGRYWVQHRERHESMLRRFTPQLLDAADVRSGEWVLDVGCGCGGTALPIARADASVSVLGVDLSAGMLAEARRLADDEGLSGVRFVQADAQAYDFGRSGFDVVLSRFGVMFFDDPVAAFTNIAAAVHPGGQLAFFCWRQAAENAFLAVPFGALARFVPLPEIGKPGAPGPFSFAEPERIRDVLGSAGFTRIAVEAVDEPMLLGSDAEDVLAYQLGTPMAKGMLAAARSAGDEVMESALAALREALAAHEGPEGVQLAGAAWLVTARRLGG